MRTVGLYLIGMFCLTFFYNGTPAKKADSPFIGDWTWGPDPSEGFSLLIKKEGNYLVGYYCDVFANGKKMDCAYDGYPSLKTPLTQGKSFTVSFISSYSHAPGLVKITVTGKKLIWHVIRRSVKEAYCPRDAVLTKQ